MNKLMVALGEQTFAAPTKASVKEYLKDVWLRTRSDA